MTTFEYKSKNTETLYNIGIEEGNIDLEVGMRFCVYIYSHSMVFIDKKIMHISRETCDEWAREGVTVREFVIARVREALDTLSLS